jgi:hypothetical protein
MSANLTEMREVTGDELRTVEGGFGILRALVVILTAEQQKEAAQPTLIHEPKHQ